MPRSSATLPEFNRGAVAEGLVTRRQLRDLNLSPGDNRGPVAVLCCEWCGYRPQWSCNHPQRGGLFRVDLAKPKRRPTLAQERALDQAMASRQTCPQCKRRYYFCLPLRTQGVCDPCHRGFEPHPDTVMTSPVTHRLAA
ncbi:MULTISPECIES: RRQRL motif-containing zinc-binding protein [Streptomyces]|uniref:RRQRL motif-containing zinc-binding protein n=1 Tax=Streptomyces TaxID=1883 RepID=UPI0027E4A879|nr:RRQRL motif-containing zinc-binding protein [Streptomyces sp. GbtcB7]